MRSSLTRILGVKIKKLRYWIDGGLHLHVSSMWLDTVNEEGNKCERDFEISEGAVLESFLVEV